MSYIESNLMPGERVTGSAQLHWIIFGGAFAWCAAGVYLASFGGEAEVYGTLCIMWAIGVAIVAYVNRKTSEFGVTNKRVLMKTGLIRRNSLEVLLAKVEGIQVNQGILGRILGYGTITITGTGGAKDPYRRIAKPLEFRRVVQEQVCAMQEAA